MGIFACPLTEWGNGCIGDDERWFKVEEFAPFVVALSQLVGVAGSPGIARGIARVVLDPGDPGELEPGDILVAPCTDPSWTPLFMTSAAVVVNVGGQISHAVIVSRELGVPCVVSITDGTQRIPNGAMIEVNGTTGVVTIL